MHPDEYQQAWKTQSAQMQCTVDQDHLLQLLSQDQHRFRSTVLWSDVAAGGIALGLIPIWIYMGITLDTPWTWYLTLPVLVWTVAFMLAYRLRRRSEPRDASGPLVDCVRQSLDQAEDQVWLQRNVFWWNLLPFAVTLITFALHSAWLRSDDWWDFLDNGFIAVVFGVCFAFMHYTSRIAVRKFETRRDHLQRILDGLQDETGDVDESIAESVSQLDRQDQVAMSGPVRMAVGFAALAAILLVLVGLFSVMDEIDFTTGYPKRAPFAAVRWDDYQPEVEVDGEWYALVSLDELPSDEIVGFSRRTYGEIWQKRFEEDLVELLTAMKHPPGEDVSLVLRSLTSSQTIVRESVRMTHANRTAIRDAAQARAIPTPRLGGESQPAVSIDDADEFRRRIDEFLSLALVRTGFSGVVVVARGGERVYEGAVGYAKLESRTRNTIETPFRIASLTKQFTAAATLSLDADERLSLDDPVYVHLPEFADEPYSGITVEHLMTHRSGLPRVPQDDERRARWNAMGQTDTAVTDYVRLASECPLESTPGERYAYSNLGYRVLSAVIAKVTDQPYADWMEQEFLPQLGLDDAGVARVSHPDKEDAIAEVVSMTRIDPNSSTSEFVPTDHQRNYGTGYGSGGMYASAADLLRWDRALAGEGGLSPEISDALFTPFEERHAPGGIVKESALDGRWYQFAAGANDGYFSRFMRVPESELVIISLGNTMETPEIDRALVELFQLCRSLPYRNP